MQEMEHTLHTGLTTKDSDFFHHSSWELEENEPRGASDSQIFQGRCYTTTEARADTMGSPGGSPDASVDVEKACPPEQGILKTIVVDIESAPGQIQAQEQAQQQQQQQQQQAQQRQTQ